MKSRSDWLVSKLVAGLMLLALASMPAAASSSTEAGLAAQDTKRSGPAVVRVQPNPTRLPVLTPAPPYRDPDRAARQPSMQELGLKVNMDLAPLRERANARGGDARLHALVGQMEHLSGDRAAAEERYQHAVRAAGKSADKLRHVLWSRGWARLYSGDNEGALLDWRDAAKLHGGKPEWYPHTLALAYWRAGQRAVGMQWFEASEIARHPDGGARLPHLGLPLIAQGLFGDMFSVRRLREQPGTPRLAAGSPALELPAYIARPPPKYPASAVAARRQGRVMAFACISARGEVSNTQIAESSGHADLDKAATDAIVQWQFRPLICGGKPRDSWVQVPVAFAVMEGGGRFPQRMPRKPDSDEAAHSRCESGVGLDPEGFTAVVAECWTHIVCSADAVWKRHECEGSTKAPATAP